MSTILQTVTIVSLLVSVVFIVLIFRYLFKIRRNLRLLEELRSRKPF